mmetsp:Transcript_7862/g.16860  ORF Transcript_7862/g.16860 Transcript_7862/m.16860 type:complete len:466 (+) Transcript_7862:146-1543(+)
MVLHSPRSHSHRSFSNKHHPHRRSPWRGCFLVSCFALVIVTLVLFEQHSSTSLRHIKEAHSAAFIGGVPLTRRRLLEAVNKHYPTNRLECGNWVESYANLHKAITTGKAPQRYAIMRSRNEFQNGLADRLASSLSVLFYAILTNRAFQYDWEGDSPLESGLKSDFIDFKYTGWDEGNTTMVLDYVADHRTAEEYFAMFWTDDPTKIGVDKHSVIWYTDHSGVYGAFDNPLLTERLAELGFQQETAFACLFDFLYRPTTDVLDMFQEQLAVLLDPDALKIGVQIRVGDWQLISSHRYLVHPQHYPALFDHYFTCAREIEHEVARQGQKVVWYVLSDMADLRPAIAAKYGPKVLVNTDVQIEHIVKSPSHSDRGFKQAVGELWTFSLTAHHVITKKSGFGKVGAMVNANGTKHIYTIDYPMQAFNFLGLGGPAFDNRKCFRLWKRPRSCRSEHADDLSKVCSDFTGC